MKQNCAFLGSDLSVENCPNNISQSIKPIHSQSRPHNPQLRMPLCCVFCKFQLESFFFRGQNTVHHSEPLFEPEWFLEFLESELLVLFI